MGGYDLGGGGNGLFFQDNQRLRAEDAQKGSHTAQGLSHYLEAKVRASFFLKLSSNSIGNGGREGVAHKALYSHLSRDSGV